ncbi:MAG: hypothetical protein PQ964_08185 [Methanobacteriaceae archaeon]|jgi:hypothetical protein
MYFTFHHLIGFSVMGFSIMALGLGLMILSYFMKDWEWSLRLIAFGLGLGTAASGWAYLRGF